MTEAVTLLGTFDTITIAFERAAEAQNLRDALGPIRADIDIPELERRTSAVLQLNLPSLNQLADLYYGHEAVIVGSGMSLDPEYVRERQMAGARIFAINKSHDYLIAHGVVPDFGMMLDPNERVSGYMTPNRRVTYILGTSCDKSVWVRFLTAGIKPFVFVPAMKDNHAHEFAANYPDADICCIYGQTTAGLRCIPIAGHMGFQPIELHAFDSCYAPGKDGLDKSGLYAVDKPTTYHDSRIDTIKYTGGGELIFATNGAMARQIIGFQSLLRDLPDMGFHGRRGLRLRVSGDGAIPWMAWKDSRANGWVSHTHPERMAAKYGQATTFNYFKGVPENEPV